MTQRMTLFRECTTCILVDNIMKKTIRNNISFRSILTTFFLSFIFLSSFVPAGALDLSKPLAGDWRCGSGAVIGTDAQGKPIYNVCKVTDIFAELKDVFIYAVIVVAFFALLSFVWIGIKGLTAADQPAVMAEAKKQGGNALIVLIVVVFFGSLFIAFASALLKSEYVNFLRQLFSLINESSFGVSIAHAQAPATAQHLPNPLVVNSVYDVGVLIYQLVMRWILIPVLIGSWVWAGFLFVQAVGNPEKIKYAKSRLLYSVIWTVILLFVLGLAYALRDTFNQIFT